MDNQNQQFDFAAFFTERVRERGLNLKKLSELSGISLRHLESMSAGNFGNLPSSPYFHGYLKKLGAILEFDSHYWWTQFKESRLVRGSGDGDRLPHNRFAPGSVMKFAWIALVALLVIGYLGFRFSSIIGRPDLAIAAPREDSITSHDPSYTLQGSVSNQSQVYVNGESVTVNPDGTWQKAVSLQYGPNSFDISAKKFLGSVTHITKQIYFDGSTQAQPIGTSTSSSVPASTGTATSSLNQ